MIPENSYGLLKNPATIDSFYPCDNNSKIRVHSGTPVYIKFCKREEYYCEFLLNEELISGVLDEEDIEPLDINLSEGHIKKNLEHLTRDHIGGWNWI